MTGAAERINVEKAISLADDLIGVIKMERESDGLMQCLEGIETLRSSWEAEFCEVQSSIEGCRKRIKECEQQIDEAKRETVPDEQLNRLQDELKEDLQNENLLLNELREIRSMIDELENKRISIEKQRADKKRKEKDESKMLNTLYMCTQVTRIIPDLDNKTGISGYIVDSENKKFEKFRFESSAASFETCNSLWKMLD
ncbi:plectin-like protein [Wolffia australiana]